MFLVLVGFAGLALDAGHLFLVHRNAQNAIDSAALAAGKKLSSSLRTGPMVSAADPAAVAAETYAASNGFFTNSSAACSSSTPATPSPGLTQFSASWVDAGTCSGGYTTMVTVYSPPQSLTPNCRNLPYNCLQAVVTRVVPNFLIGVLGQRTTTITTSATVFAQPAGTVANLPAPVAVYLYQPQAGCDPGSQQCFSETAPPQRANLSCSGQNCPTFWVRPGTRPTITGINGRSTPSGDTVALQSNGDMVLQDATTICDPYGGPCSPPAAGALGFAVAAGSKLYCTGSTPAGITPIPCTAAGPGGTGLGPLIGNETGFASQSWPASVDTSGLSDCGALVLNGDRVANSGATTACQPPASDPYTILPGRYAYIVINHGTYDFRAGVYQITGTAPQNSAPAGTLANGIDHSTETAADWDLCPPGPCPTVTAGVWIGHGGPPFQTGAAGSGITCEDGAPAPVQAGGDATNITGVGVTFKLEAGGIVSTHEVTSISLAAPNLGAQPRTGLIPLLFDLENGSFVHLDSAPSPSSHFGGIVYQSSTFKTGGVEINPGLGGGKPALLGQVLAYSFTTFGGIGPAIDFSQGLNGASSPPQSVSGGDNEPEILGLPPAALVAPTPPKPGFQSLVWHYDDEWKLNAYTTYVRVNNGAPVYFSQGIWNPAPSPGTPLPPRTNTPGDTAPAFPAAAQDPTNKYAKTQTNVGGISDWTMTYPSGATFELNGGWVWGHEEMIPGTSAGSNQVTLIYTFPVPPGPQSTITLFMVDGDSCGDWVTVTITFNNIGSPSPGQQSAGTVHLEQ